MTAVERDIERLQNLLQQNVDCSREAVARAYTLSNRMKTQREKIEKEIKEPNNTEHLPSSNKENLEITNLRKQNQELSQIVSELQTAMSLMMKKYRIQVQTLENNHGNDTLQLKNHIENEELKSDLLIKENIQLRAQNNELRQVMCLAANLDDQYKDTMVSQLEEENKMLRQLLEISSIGNAES